MSFLKKLFGGGASDVNGADHPVAETDYAEFNIQTFPMKEGSQYRVCAMIRKEVDGVMREHRLIRADVCGSKEEASKIAINKAKQMIDERGGKIFD